MSESFDKLDDATNAYALTLRMGDDHNQLLYERMCDDIRDYLREFVSTGSVPREAVLSLVGLSDILSGCTSLYP
jgi:hypothetical protein